MTESGRCKLADFGVSAEISALTHRAQTGPTNPKG